VRVGVVATTGSAKSGLIREMMRGPLADWPKIVYTAKPWEMMPGREPTPAATEAVRQSLCRPYVELLVNRPEVLVQLLPTVYARGRIALIIDEAHQVLPRVRYGSHDVPAVKAWEEILRMGRGIGIPVVWATQMPADCAKVLFGNTTAWFIGQLPHTADQRTVSSAGVEPPQQLYTFRWRMPDGVEGELKTSRAW
jgi:hypothetical protein